MVGPTHPAAPVLPGPAPGPYYYDQPPTAPAVPQEPPSWIYPGGTAPPHPIAPIVAPGPVQPLDAGIIPGLPQQFADKEITTISMQSPSHASVMPATATEMIRRPYKISEPWHYIALGAVAIYLIYVA